MATEFTTKTHDTTKQMNRSSGSYELAFAPVILGLLGLWLDRTIGTTPLMVVLFSIVGFVGTGIKIYYGYRYEMAQHEGTVAWKGHESSSEFRRHGAERLARNAQSEADGGQGAAS